MVGQADNDAWRPQALGDLSQAQLENGDAAAAYATAQQALDYGRKALRRSHQNLFLHNVEETENRSVERVNDLLSYFQP